MSTESPCRTLAEYVSELMSRLGLSDPAALARLRHVVGLRRARMSVDSETIDVQWAGELLHVSDPGNEGIHGTGHTDRQTVLDLLAGELEVHDAILDGRLEVTGEIDAIQRMFLALEILLDAAARSPSLQALAKDYGADPCLAARRPPRPRGLASGTEHELLARLGLLP